MGAIGQLHGAEKGNGRSVVLRLGAITLECILVNSFERAYRPERPAVEWLVGPRV